MRALVLLPFGWEWVPSLAGLFCIPDLRGTYAPRYVIPPLRGCFLLLYIFRITKSDRQTRQPFEQFISCEYNRLVMIVDFLPIDKRNPGRFLAAAKRCFRRRR
jgi:hypothetical protein